MKQSVGAHQHARRAEATLQAVLLVERLLHCVQHTFVRQALNGQNLLAVTLDGQMGARLDGLPVNIDGAGATVAGLTAYVGPREVQFFAQVMD